MRQALKSGKLRHIARNFYATEASDSILGALSKLYPDAIVTGSTALYVHGLIDNPPDRMEVVTKRGGTRIANPAFSQSFISQEWLQVGVAISAFNGVEVKMFDLERILLELMRSRNKLPYDTYRKAVISFRKYADTLDIYKLEEYASSIPRGRSFSRRAIDCVF